MDQTAVTEIRRRRLIARHGEQRLRFEIIKEKSKDAKQAAAIEAQKKMDQCRVKHAVDIDAAIDVIMNGMDTAVDRYKVDFTCIVIYLPQCFRDRVEHLLEEANVFWNVVMSDLRGGGYRVDQIPYNLAKNTKIMNFLGMRHAPEAAMTNRLVGCMRISLEN